MNKLNRRISFQRHPLRKLFKTIPATRHWIEIIDTKMPAKNLHLYSKARETIIFNRDIAKMENLRKMYTDLKEKRAKTIANIELRRARRGKK